MSADTSVTGLERLLEGAAPAGVVETRALLADLLRPARTAGLLEEQMIWRARVHRARFRVDGVERTFILKRLPLDRAHREQLAVRHWLPRLGLAAHGSPLLGVAAARRAECIWHAYPIHDCNSFFIRDSFNTTPMRRHFGFLVLVLLISLLLLLTGCVTRPGNGTQPPTPTVDPTRCTNDSQCVPAQCCHPTSCINEAYKEVCTVFCTMECSGPIDCGAGHCVCVNGKCQVIPGPE